MRFLGRTRTSTTVRALALGVTLAAGLSACDDATSVATTPLDVQFNVTREVQGAEAKSILPFTPTVTVKPGEIDVFNNIRTPNPCAVLGSVATTSGSTITLAVSAVNPTMGVCAQVITVRDYNAAILNVKSGTYTLRIEHHLSWERTPELVLEKQVVVP